MPKNPFAPTEGEFRLPRNQVDLSERRLFTSDFGKLVPFFCREVLPGQSFEIDATVGLRGMPTVFPVQTRMRMSVEFYLCRNRCAWPDFEDFIFKTKDNLVAPWLKMNNDRAKTMISTGSLGDMFRIATTIGSSGSASGVLRFGDLQYQGNGSFFDYDNQVVNSFYSSSFHEFSLNSTRANSAFSFVISQPIYSLPSSFEFVGTCNTSLPAYSVTPDNNTFRGLVSCIRPDGKLCFILVPVGIIILSDHSASISYSISDSLKSVLSSSLSYGPINFGISCTLFSGNPLEQSSPTNVLPWDLRGTYYTLNFSYPVDNVIDSTDDSVISSNPYIGNSPSEKINALPFRHYEMICNYYYRNDKNNPIVYNGQVEYNKFIPTKEGGADENVYDFHYRNFELDMFTSATQSPQFGEAPLVGLTYNPTGEHATLSFSATNEDGETHTYKATVGLDDDGTLKDIANFDSDIPSANLRRLQEAINYGISINDFRLGNSFQRFKENVLRRGMRYRNQLLSHFGVSVDYPDIDIPQYIGGISGLIEPGQVTNTGNDPNSGLGSFVGTLQGGVSTNHKIRCYSPEHGFIIGIVSFYPIPMYCQNTDSVMLKRDAFDYAQAEFGKIGFVPITYSEVFPLQVPVGASRSDVFGYQKAWYPYFRSYDSVHGDFRTTLRDFALMRTFSQRPVLGRDFTEVHPEQFNDIFVANNVADANGSDAKFMLSSSVHCISKVPLPVFGTPSLE